MVRTCAALSVFSLLALVFVIGLNSGNSVVSGLLPGRIDFQPMVNANSGQPLTLGVIQQDILWHRDTAQKLRDLN